jgi:hypothetical protein
MPFVKRDRLLAALSCWLFLGDQAGRGPSNMAAKRERERLRFRQGGTRIAKIAQGR